MKFEGTTLRKEAVRLAEVLSLVIERLRRPSPVSVLVFFSGLVLLRLPNLVLHGRIWAEEGSNYLDTALKTGWYGGLTQVWGDYFNLWANLATTVAAQTFPLEYAPYVTLVFALVAQSLPIAVLVFLSETLFVPVVGALLIATLPMAEEVWLNTINSQAHLLLASGFVLALPTPPTRIKRTFCYVLLLITSLSSPASIVMTALLSMRAVLDRSWCRARQAVAMGIGATVQLIIILAYLRPDRTIGIDPQLLAAVVCLKHIFVPFLGVSGAAKVARLLSLQEVSAAVIAGIVFGWAALLAVLARADRTHDVAFHFHRIDHGVFICWRLWRQAGYAYSPVERRALLFCARRRYVRRYNRDCRECGRPSPVGRHCARGLDGAHRRSGIREPYSSYG